VNAWDAEVAIVSSVGIDHTDWLGRTRVHRARKGAASIARSAVPSARPNPAGQPDSVRRTDRRAPAVRAQGFRFRTFAGRLDLARARTRCTPGCRIRRCAATTSCTNARVRAHRALDCLAERFPVNMADIRAGLLNAVLPGRFQTLPGRPVRVLDVAHNAQAAEALARTLRAQVVPGRTIAVCGMLHDKPIVDVLRILGALVSRWPCRRTRRPRAARAPEDMRAALAAVA